ncbi:hypothetical protein CBS101457_005534 [Exobasidium rhododendri]|nr:hypothetical protein CBS101457_005534 [Exobasidium rhododendri]
MQTEYTSKDENEWDGAQVVVLKQGKHLSKDEAAVSNGTEKEAVTEEASFEEIAPNMSASRGKTYKKGSGLEDAKRLIASSKSTEGPEAVVDDEVQKRKSRQEEKDIELKKKNKRARHEKSKMGKGLSFDLND